MGEDHADRPSRNVDTFEAGVVATATVIGAWIGESGGSYRRVAAAMCLAAVAGVAVHLRARARRMSGHDRARGGGVRQWVTVALCLFTAGIAAARSSSEWESVGNVRLGAYSGPARMVGDVRAAGRGLRVTFEIEGQRFEAWVFGSDRFRVHRLESGDVVGVDGVRRGLDDEFGRRSQLRHVVGRFDVEDLSTATDAYRLTSPLMRAANRVRSLLSAGAQRLPEDRAALFTGLVYGDDSSQSNEMLARFRSSGLAHLTAVSGQNVVFVLTMAGPVLTRVRRPARIGVTIVVLTWFAIMTRLEPSVVRAVVMAGVAAVMMALGRPVSSWAALCATVVLVTLVDPFLVWSVGWWLSVAGCTGLIAFTPSISAVLSRSTSGDSRTSRLATWVGPMVAAQTGVMAVMVAVFGWPSAMSIPCNLLAAPVAGIVMLVGMPVALAAGAMPSTLATLLMWPIGLGVAWVDGVAAIGSRLDPPTVIDVSVSVGVVGAALWATLSFGRESRSRKATNQSVTNTV